MTKTALDVTEKYAERLQRKSQAFMSQEANDLIAVAREMYGIDWPHHAGFVTVSAADMVLEPRKAA